MFLSATILNHYLRHLVLVTALTPFKSRWLTTRTMTYLSFLICLLKMFYTVFVLSMPNLLSDKVIGMVIAHVVAVCESTFGSRTCGLPLTNGHIVLFKTSPKGGARHQALPVYPPWFWF